MMFKHISRLVADRVGVVSKGIPILIIPHTRIHLLSRCIWLLLSDWLILFVLFAMLDGPAVVRVNIFVRSISKIDDVTMVSWQKIKSECNAPWYMHNISQTHTYVPLLYYIYIYTHKVTLSDAECVTLYHVLQSAHTWEKAVIYI